MESHEEKTAQEFLRERAERIRRRRRAIAGVCITLSVIYLGTVIIF